MQKIALTVALYAVSVLALTLSAWFVCGLIGI